MERGDRNSSPEHLQSSSQNQGRQHCPANHALSSGVGSTGQCKPLPFFGRCYHCNKSNSVARVSRGAEPSEPRGKCLVALSETGAKRRWRCRRDSNLTSSKGHRIPSCCTGTRRRSVWDGPSPRPGGCRRLELMRPISTCLEVRAQPNAPASCAWAWRRHPS